MGRQYVSYSCSIFPSYMESNALEKSTNSSVASSFFARTPSMMRWITNFCVIEEPLLQKPFWLFKKFSQFRVGYDREIEYYTFLAMLYIHLRPGRTCLSKDGGSCIFRWPVMGKDCVGELGWQYGTRLKSNGAVTNWCTGRGWPVNCMTVISTRWWSNMPFQGRQMLHIPLACNGKRLSGRKTII